MKKASLLFIFVISMGFWSTKNSFDIDYMLTNLILIIKNYKLFILKVNICFQKEV